MSTDFEIIKTALTGWDDPEPTEVPPARAALARIEARVAGLETMPDDDTAESWAAWLEDRGASFDPHIQGPRFKRLADWVRNHSTTR